MIPAVYDDRGAKILISHLPAHASIRTGTDFDAGVFDNSSW
jgi:hypothetical protein